MSEIVSFSFETKTQKFPEGGWIISITTVYIYIYYCLCTASEGLRLVGGTSRCSGTLQIHKYGEWRPGNCGNPLNPSALCRELDCGSIISTELGSVSRSQPLWDYRPSCDSSYGTSLQMICSGNTKLVCACKVTATICSLQLCYMIYNVISQNNYNDL